MRSSFSSRSAALFRSEINARVVVLFVGRDRSHHGYDWIWVFIPCRFHSLRCIHPQRTAATPTQERTSIASWTDRPSHGR